jgi:ribose-phosphate pyrophosphokinase
LEARLQVFSGSSNRELAAEITECLGVPFGRATVGKHRDGETMIRLDEHVRGSDVFVVQTLCDPVNHHIMEMLLLVDAVRRCSASRVTAVIPYMAYGKQEKKTVGGREPISAKLLANIMTTAGVDRLLTIDLHKPAIEGFFDIPVDHMRVAGMLAARIERLDLADPVVVSPNAGGVARANELRERLGASLAMVYRPGINRRNGNDLEIMGDVEGKQAIIIDDMITTGQTLLSAAEAVLRKGAAEVYACATHGIFVDEALDLIERSPIRRVFVTNTIPHSAKASVEKLEVVSMAPLLSEAIVRIHKDISLSSLFM